MSYARHVGRVGALAVALGVGLEVPEAPRVTWAEKSPVTTTYTPTPGTRMTDTIRFTVHDGRGGFTAVPLKVTIYPTGAASLTV
ncbi:Ig-like domain-containing protein [Mycolicibacterium phlei]|jgi:hypothetical protein